LQKKDKLTIMKMKSVLVALVSLGLVALSAPAFADTEDISADMTIDNSTFISGELNAESVAIGFPLVTDIVGDRFYVDLPVGYVFNASTSIGSTIESYDPATGICGTVDTGVTIPALASGPYLCTTGGSDFPFEFVLLGNVPSGEYVIQLAAGSFRALTTETDVAGEITISIAISGDPQVTDDYGHVDVMTLAKKLPDTGIDVFALTAVGALAGLSGLAAVVFVSLRRRSRV
jgi:LPXTG-motif cell wall-anchored protein